MTRHLACSGRAAAMIVLAMALVMITGCHSLRAKSCHNVQPYMSAKSITPLHIPDGLDAPDTSNALHIPQLNEPAPPARKGKEPCLDEPPAYNVPKPKPAPQA